MSEPVIIVKSCGKEVGRCDERCYDGISWPCYCCCGGVNHGVGHVKAIANTRNIYKAVIAARFPVSFEPLEVSYILPDPELFKKIYG